MSYAGDLGSGAVRPSPDTPIDRLTSSRADGCCSEGMDCSDACVGHTGGGQNHHAGAGNDTTADTTVAFQAHSEVDPGGGAPFRLMDNPH